MSTRSWCAGSSPSRCRRSWGRPSRRSTIGRPSGAYPYRFVGYRLLPGRESQDARGHFDPAALGTTLGRVLDALHAIPEAEVGAAGVERDAWRDDLPGRAAHIEEFLARLPDDAARRLAVLRRPPDSYRGPVRFLHGDLQPCHVLVENGAVSGLIDWGDVALGDPAVDLAGVLYAAGPDGLRACLAAYRQPLDDGAVERARFYLGCMVAMDLVWAAATARAAIHAAAMRALDFVS